MKSAVKFTAILLLVCLLIIGTAAATEERITNGNFANGMTGWTMIDIDNSGAASVGPTTDFNNDYACLEMAYDTVNGDKAYAGIKQTVDLTGVSTITYKVYKDSITTGGYFYATIDSTSTGSAISGGDVKQKFDPYSLSATSYTTYTIDVSEYTGNHVLTIYVTASGLTGGRSETAKVYIRGISAIGPSIPAVTEFDIVTDPVLTTDDTAAVTYKLGTGDVTSDLQLIVSWGDGTQDTYSLAGKSTGVTYTVGAHQYSTVGDKTISAWTMVSGGKSTATITATQHVISLSISASDINPQVGDTITFEAITGGLNSLGTPTYLWNFNYPAGPTSQYTTAQYIYTTAGTYTVRLTLSWSGYDTKYVEKTITAGSTYVRFVSESYDQGQTATIQYSINNPDYITYTYQLGIISVTSGGNVLSPLHTITVGDTSYQWSTAGAAGEYYPVIYRNSNLYAQGSVATVSTYAAVTVYLSVAGVDYVNASTQIDLLQNGIVKYSYTTTATGTIYEHSHTFPAVKTGTYTIRGTTVGYSTVTSQELSITSATSYTIDFVSGGGTGQNTAGAGLQYASTFVTFRVVDKMTGAGLPGAEVLVVGKAATNPIEWTAQIFGGTLGQTIINSNQTGITDDEGVITFMMLPNTRYAVTVNYLNGQYTNSYSFQSSTLTGEYKLELEITKIEIKQPDRYIHTNVSADNGIITMSYYDELQTTSNVNITVYQKLNDEYVQIGNATTYQNDNDFTYQSDVLTDYNGQSYKLHVVITSSTYGTVTKDFGVSFAGLFVDLGIDDRFYIWICLGILLMLAGIGTIITSPAYAFVVVFVAWMLYAFGWMFALGVGAIPILILATVFAILFYLSSRSKGGY